MKGVFISFEGIEGTGKTTQAEKAAEYLRKEGHSVLRTMEPGGTKISLKIREMLLSLENIEMDPVTELLLYNAARVQHIKEVIMPALERGDIVITDRFSDSTFAYQGYARGIDLELIYDLDRIATGGLRPDITVLLNTETGTGLARNRAVKESDRLEIEDITFHEKVRKGFIQIATREPERVKVVDSSENLEMVQQRVIKVLADFLGRKSSSSF